MTQDKYVELGNSENYTQHQKKYTNKVSNNKQKSNSNFNDVNKAIKAEIKRRVPISSLLGSYGVRNIKNRSGDEKLCACPFHKDTKPSFSLNDSKGLYNCFSCGAKGDVFNLIMKIEGINFKQALKKLSMKANVPLTMKCNKNNRGKMTYNKTINEKGIGACISSSQVTSNSNIEVINVQDKNEEIKRKEAVKNLLILLKNSSTADDEISKHKYAIKKEIEVNLHNGQLRIGNDKGRSVIYVPAFKVGNEDIETVQFITEDSKDNKRWKSGIAIEGVFYPMGIKATEIANCKELILCEGFATGEKIYSSIDKEKPVLSCFSKSNIYNVINNIKGNNPDIKIIVACDFDAYDEIKNKLSESVYGNLYICKPCLTEAEQEEFKKYEQNINKHPDFWDLWKIVGAERVKEELRKVEEIEYEEDMPVEFSLDQVGSTNIDCLGDNIIIRFIKEVSRSTETPIEFTLFSIFSAISTCVMGKVFVKIKDDYIEPIILSTIIIAKSGEGKTPVYNHVMKPILEKQKEYREEYKIKFREFQHQNKLKDEEIRKLKDEAKKHSIEVNIKDVMDIENKKIGEPVDPTITAQDITPEQITNKLVRQGGKIAIIDHEGGIFNTIAGRYNSNGTANTDVFTKGYNGSELKVDRGDKSVDLDNAYVLLLIFLQPNIFKRIKNFGHFVDSGFFARTLFLYPKSRVEHRTHKEPTVNLVIKNEYINFIQCLMTDEKLSNNKTYLQFSNEAQEVYINFCTSIAKERAIGGEFEDDLLGGWAEKLKGNIARLAGILHIIANFQNNIVDTEISKETLGKAIELSMVLIEHAKVVFNYVGPNEEKQDAIDLWRYIENKKLGSFTEAEILQKQRNKKRLQEKNNMTLALEVLMERNIIFEVKNIGKTSAGRPLSTKYKVNNRIIEKW